MFWENIAAFGEIPGGGCQASGNAGWGLFLMTEDDGVSVGQGLVTRMEVDYQAFLLSAAFEHQRGKGFQRGLEAAALEGGVPQLAEGLQGHVFPAAAVNGVFPELGGLHDFVEADVPMAVHLYKQPEKLFAKDAHLFVCNHDTVHARGKAFFFVFIVLMD